MVNIDITVISDPVCPFCYIAKKRLDKAIALHKRVVAGGAQDTFTVTWAPFYLDFEAPKVGVPVVERLAQRYGADQVERKKEQLRRMGRPEGIAFAFGNRIGHTRDAHRLLAMARRQEGGGGGGVQDAVADALFRSYFEEGGDITSHEMLVEAGRRGGLDAEEVRAWLRDGSGGEEVDREVDEAYNQAGVRGVPKIVINGRFEIDGAQDVQDFLLKFAEARESAC